MTRCRCVAALLLAASCAPAPGQAPDPGAEKLPNIIYIYADELGGWGADEPGGQWPLADQRAEIVAELIGAAARSRVPSEVFPSPFDADRAGW